VKLSRLNGYRDMWIDSFVEGKTNMEDKETKSLTWHTNTLLIFLAWSLMLTVSDLPDIILHYLGIAIPTWLVYVKITVDIIFIVICLFFKSTRPLWTIGLYFLVFFLANWISPFDWWVNLFGTPPTWVLGHLGAQIGGLLALAFVLVAFFLVKRNWSALFIRKGQLDANLEPVLWLGIKKGEKWTTFAWIFAGVFAGGMLLFLFLAFFSVMRQIGKVLPLLPAIFLLSALNAITEELTFRAPLLASSHDVIGKQHALWLSSVFFGLAHVINGSPQGVVGFLLISLAAYLYGKSMLETGGSFWAIVMHFISDLPVFTFMALQYLGK
jgi:membrane protease YdiL (CAAX protease family)